MDEYSALAQRVAADRWTTCAAVSCCRGTAWSSAPSPRTTRRTMKPAWLRFVHARVRPAKLRGVRRPDLGLRLPRARTRRSSWPGTSVRPGVLLDQLEHGAAHGRGVADRRATRSGCPEAPGAPSGKPRTSAPPAGGPTGRRSRSRRPAVAPSDGRGRTGAAAPVKGRAPVASDGRAVAGCDADVGRRPAADGPRRPRCQADGERRGPAVPEPAAPFQRPTAATPRRRRFRHSAAEARGRTAESATTAMRRSTASCWPKSSRGCFRWTRTVTKQVPDDLARTDAEGPTWMTTVKRKSKQLGQILIELGYITPEQLEVALEEHRKTPKSLGRVLIDIGMIKEARPGPRPRRAGRPGVRGPRRDFPVDPTSTVLLPEALARRYRALPIGERDGQAPRRDVGPGQRLRARRHPDDHRARRAAGRGDRRTTSSARSRSSRAWTPRSRRSRASWPSAEEGEDGASWRRRSRTRRSSSS